MNFTIDASDFLRGLEVTDDEVIGAAAEAMEDNTDDLARIAQNIAPINKGILRRGMKKKFTLTRNRMIGEVSFRAVENGFNYAIWTHEADYNLGPASAQAGGTDGYTVGNKYLERPLKGESDRYLRNVENAVRRVLR
ncbi:hypothetical protein P9D51_10965 [Bacillus sonorensis]|uniref:hypothetical protein n=1 Tax=Bacillus sonorensis TaxID=119858 RepID=UPI002DBAF219|nr:hypothetical protein [Bacillus sonorensis]MEC1426625.1 hypothetical protein [Bacillus sonorensis]